MFHISEINIQPLVHYLHAHPHAAGLITFLVVFTEAMAVIGVIVPGSITMTAIGILIGSSVVPAGSTFMWAIAGALTGDYLSYLLGIYFRDRIHKIWPFTRWPGLLGKSEKFFREHGGKSVFIGRFIGPTRAMIPLVAGVLKMPLGRFLVAAIPSASLWAIGYMIPGVLLGALSLELPPKVATKFTLWAILIIVGIWLLVWLLQHYFRSICQMVDYYVMHAWRYMKRHKTLSWFTRALEDPRAPDSHQQLTLVCAALIAVTFFFMVMQQINLQGALTYLNQPLYYLLTSFRITSVDHFMVSLTMLADYKVIAITALLFFLWLIDRKKWYTAFHWLALVGASFAIDKAIKTFVYSPRPPLVQGMEYASSFPSGHTALSVAIFGFLAVIIARELKPSKRWIPYTVVALLVIVIACSRLYLGAHWLTDIFGSILIALPVVLLATLSYRRRHTEKLKATEVGVTAASILVAVWFGYSLIFFPKEVRHYELAWPKQTINYQIWTQQQAALPLYRLNRLGWPIEAFNVEWAGDINAIRSTLLQQGWEEQPIKLDLQNIVKSFAETSIIHHLPIFPQLYHNNRLSLLMIMTIANNEDAVLILRLWQSDITFNDNSAPLWIGSVEYHQGKQKLFSLHRKKNKAPFVGATEFLTEYLQNFHWQQKVVPPELQPAEMRGLGWDGKVLLINN